MDTHLHPGTPSDALLRLAAEEHQRRKHHVRVMLILAVSIAAVLGGIVYAIKDVARSQQPDKVVIDPARLPPIRPGPQ